MKKLSLYTLLLMLLAVNLSALLPTKDLKRIHCKIKRNKSTWSQNSLSQTKTLNQTTSKNWSGYASVTKVSKPKRKSVSKVSGYWIVPALHPTVNDSFCTIWVGIDGISCKTVEQIGTAHNSISHAQVNYAWFEMFPHGSFKLEDFPVNPGDLMAAEVSYKGRGRFQLSLYNYTQMVYTIVPARYTKSHSAARKSAEWIVEAPANRSGVLPLADFNAVTFTDCEATIKGKTGTIRKYHRKDDSIVMAYQNLTIKADPTALSKDGKSFTVNWVSE